MRKRFFSFEEGLGYYGIPYPKKTLMIGKFTRWGDKTGDTKYWAIKHDNGIINFGDWSRDISDTFYPQPVNNAYKLVRR